MQISDGTQVTYIKLTCCPLKLKFFFHLFAEILSRQIQRKPNCNIKDFLYCPRNKIALHIIALNQIILRIYQHLRACRELYTLKKYNTLFYNSL